MTACPMPVPVPHVGGPLLALSPVHVAAQGAPVARLGDTAQCAGGAPDVVGFGSQFVLVHGLPVAYVGCSTAHGGTVAVTTNTTVFVGGPEFRPPSNMKIVGPPEFQNQTLRDLFVLSSTPSGSALLAALEARGLPIVVEPESDPYNSFAVPHDMMSSQNGVGTGSTLKYNPCVAVEAYDAMNNRVPCPPQIVLGHELIQALHFAYGQSATHAPDPHGPASQPDIPREAAHTIGTGSYHAAVVSENRLRAELGLPRRDNHATATTDLLGNPLRGPTYDMRPGGY